nr:hypothetical protein [Amphritea balenae]
MGRYKAIIGPRLRARSLDGQRSEATIGVSALNRMLAVGRPKSVRRVGKAHRARMEGICLSAFIHAPTPLFDV